MTLPSINPEKLSSWSKLKERYDILKDVHLKTLFSKEASRADKMTIQWEDFYVDYSKNRIDAETLQLLFELTKETKLKEAIES
ncbi:MAG: glucose-6-phosphate isomerase, partial [Mangrovimonas sp.]|nr:glucose-6-phosphate isomerase [Mangrovimonas sp.]